MDKLLLTVQEAANRLSMSRAALYPLVTSGQIDSVLIGRSRRIHVVALEAFVARLTAEQAGREA